MVPPVPSQANRTHYTPGRSNHHIQNQTEIKMTADDYQTFMAGLDTIRPARPLHFHAESDGDINARTHYVRNTVDVERIECRSRTEAHRTASQLNAEVTP